MKRDRESLSQNCVVKWDENKTVAVIITVSEEQWAQVRNLHFARTDMLVACCASKQHHHRPPLCLFPYETCLKLPTDGIGEPLLQMKWEWDAH